MADQFNVIRTGTQKQVNQAQPPPDELLQKHPDGTIVVGPDKVQWYIAPAQPRRWQRVKKARGSASS